MKSNCWIASAAVVLASAIAGCSTGTSAPAQAPKPVESARLLDKAVGAVYPALVRINVVTTSASDGRMRKFQAAGSGVIISPDGYVVTNHHVAARSERLVCRLADRQEIDATLVGSDPMTDIAVLKLKCDQLKAPAKTVPWARFGDSEAVRVGDTVLAMGSPAGLSQTVTVGVVANAQMILPWGTFVMEGEPVGMLVRWIGHDATIFHGNSGGPLVNLQGRIIGINELGIGGIGGAIPGNLVQSVVQQLKRDGKVARSWTGMETQAMLKSDKGESGVLVAGVVGDSPAAKAGLQSGDVILEYDGQPVKATVDEELPLFNQLVLSGPVGKTVLITYRRGDERKLATLTSVARERAIAQNEELKGWGMTAMDLTRTFALEAQRPNKDGVWVETVRLGGPCNQAKPAIDPGDVIVEVNGKKIKDAAELRNLTREITKDSTVQVEALVAYERGVKKLLTVVRVGKEPEKDEPSQARKAWLGVATQVLTTDLAKALDLADKTGVRITQVLPGTTAQEAKLQVGDIILKFDGEAISARQVEDEEVFPAMVRKRKIGQEVELGIVRDGQPTTMPVKLQEPPTPASELKVYRNDDFEFAARDMSFLDKTDKKLDIKTQGVLISRVERAGWASLGGLEGGDVLLNVDGKSVTSIEALKKVLEEAKSSRPQRMVFMIKRGIHTRYLELSPSWEK